MEEHQAAERAFWRRLPPGSKTGPPERGKKIGPGDDVLFGGNHYTVASPFPVLAESITLSWSNTHRTGLFSLSEITTDTRSMLSIRALAGGAEHRRVSRHHRAHG